MDMVPLNNQGASVNGSDGVAVAGTDICKGYEVSANGIALLNFIVSGWSAGAVTVNAKGFN